ncbi:hypothetical protein ACFZ8E_07575 [Methylobacterium sp. HMF5984]|uniref:hypothetical protein n=1 Tax=Methylobacterium sp. HMF5984 TaxID=3367370 RepID=UPI003852C709
MSAFMVIRTVNDLFTAMSVMRAGHVLGFMAEPGHLFGPTRPTQLRTDEPGKKKSFTRYTATDMPSFLFDYLGDRRPVSYVVLTPCADHPWIERVWECINHAAGLPLNRLVIIRLVRILAEYVGGSCEPQMCYGDPQWVEFAKEGLGTLVCYSKPGPSDLATLVERRIELINAANIGSMVGMAGAAMLPDRGVIRDVSGKGVEAAYDASGRPTGFGADFDAVAAFYRPVGLPCEPEMPLKMRQTIEHACRLHSKEVEGPLSCVVWTCEGPGSLSEDGNRRHLTLMHLPVEKLTAPWISMHWSTLTRIRFTS